VFASPCSCAAAARVRVSRWTGETAAIYTRQRCCFIGRGQAEIAYPDLTRREQNRSITRAEAVQ
jgi:hypothetical protein